MSFILKIKTDYSNVYNERKNFKEDSGVDLYCPEDIIIPPNSTYLVNLGVRCQMFRNGELCGYFLIPSSSISKTPLRLSNSVGLIDKLYTGEIKASVDNISNQEYKISKGDRLFQLIHPMLEPIEIELVDELVETKRGDGGFGSTGK